MLKALLGDVLTTYGHDPPTQAGTLGLSRDECMCIPGSVDITLMRGMECEECPSGAICAGHEALSLEQRSPAGTNLTNNASSPQQLVFKNTLPYPDENFWANSAYRPAEMTFFECASGRCRGNFECEPGYTGTLCASCEDGYYGIGIGSCRECFKYRWANVLFVVVSTTVVLCVWYVLNTIAADGFDSFDVVLIYLQLLSMIQQFALRFPDELSPYKNAVAIINFGAWRAHNTPCMMPPIAQLLRNVCPDADAVPSLLAWHA